MPLVEGAALAVLPGETHGRALQQQRTKGQCLGHAVIEEPLAAPHLPALLEQLLDLGMNMKVARIAGETVADLLDCRGAQAGVDLVFRLVSSSRIIRPIGRKLCQHRALGHPGRLLLRFGQLNLHFLDPRGGVHSDLPGIDLVERGMILDLCVTQRLRDGRVVHFAVAMAAVTDQVDDHIGVEGIPVFHGQRGDTDCGLGIFCVDMEDGNRQPLADV